MFSGSIVALVTPFTDDGALDETKLEELIEFQIQNGTKGIVPCGTTGESPTLSHEEHEKVIDLTVEVVNGRIPVIAGAGSNSTSEALRLTRHAKVAGADGALVITPYYNRPTQKGLYEHFMRVADSVEIPIIIYNVPSRTGTDILPETLARLSGHPNIIGIKEATGSLRRASEVLQQCGEDFVVLSGEDAVNFPLMAVGGKGAISVVANVAPRLLADLCDAALAWNWDAARRLHYESLPLSIALFLETNPIPVKAALQIMGMLNGRLRLPLATISAENRQQLKSVLEKCGLI